MNELNLVSSDDLLKRINQLLSMFSNKMKDLSVHLHEVEKLYKEIVLINQELTKRNIEVDDSCLTETKKILEISQESFSGS